MMNTISNCVGISGKPSDSTTQMRQWEIKRSESKERARERRLAMETARAALEEELRQARIDEENTKLTVDADAARSAKRERDAVTRALRLAKRMHGDREAEENQTSTDNPDDSYMDHPAEADWASLSLANQIAGTEGTLQVCRVAVSKHGIALRAKWRHVTNTRRQKLANDPPAEGAYLAGIRAH